MVPRLLSALERKTNVVFLDGLANSMLHKQEVTSELHKLTNCKSNYTSTMYMKVNTSLYNEDANQREDKEDTVIFILRFTCLPTR